MKKILLVVLVIVLAVGAGLLLKKRKKSVAETPRPTPPAFRVKTVMAHPGTIEETRTFLAKLEAKKSATLSAKQSGRITRMIASESQKVAKGDVLLHIDDAEIMATIDSLKSTLPALENETMYSKDQYERNRILFKAGGLAREKLDASEAVYLNKQAALESTRLKIKALRAQHTYYTITAPFAATVGSLFQQEGDLATAGLPLLSINSFEQKLTFSYVPEKSFIAIQQDVLLDNTRIGEISNLYADAENGLSVAEVLLDKRLDLANGSYITIDVVTRVKTGCTIPLNALVHQQEGVKVMAYKKKGFEPVSVTVLAENREFVVIDPCVSFPVAVAAETKLSLLPSFGAVRISTGNEHE